MSSLIGTDLGLAKVNTILKIIEYSARAPFALVRVLPCASLVSSQDVDWPSDVISFCLLHLEIRLRCPVGPPVEYSGQLFRKREPSCLFEVSAMEDVRSKSIWNMLALHGFDKGFD